MTRIMALFMVALFMFELPQTEGLTLRRGEDDGGEGGDGDDGAGGLAGALSGLMGGGGGAGDGGADDDSDDDPNMVGGKKKKHHKSGGGGVDLSGLENGLKSGGISQLTMMLKAMRAAHGSEKATQHIIKGDNGEEMYDFRDLDDGTTTTMAPITVTEKVTQAPTPMVAVPDAPSITLAGGKISGLKAAEAAAGKAVAADKVDEAAANKAKASQKHLEELLTASASDRASVAAKKNLVVWPPTVAPRQLAMPVQPMQRMPVQQVAQQPLLAAQPMVMAPPQSMMAAPPMFANQMPQADSNSASGLYQGLAMLNQNMNVLMNEAASLNSKAQADTGSLATKLDQTSKNFMSYEHKMESQMQKLEDENSLMRKQIREQAKEIKVMEQEVRASKKQSHGSSDGTRSTFKSPRPNTTVPTVASNKTPKLVTLKSTAKKAVKTANHNVSHPQANPNAPWDATFSVHIDGKSGGQMESFTIRVHPQWAPQGAKRFQEILQAGILQDARFFRVVPGFMAQFGIAGSPKLAAHWVHKRITDDPVKKSNSRGMVTFASAGANSRTTQMFINYADNNFLDNQGFAPFAEVLGDGMKVVDRIQAKYKERPNQAKIQHHGNKYLMKHFPQLSFIDHVDTTLPTAASLIQKETTFYHLRPFGHTV